MGAKESIAGKLGSFTGIAEDEGRAGLRMRQQGCQGMVLGQRAKDMIADGGPVAAGPYQMRFFMGENEVVQTLENRVVGGCRKAEDLPDGKIGYERSEGGQGRSETFPPANDGMGFIDHHQADAMTCESWENRLLTQAFGIGDDHFALMAVESLKQLLPLFSRLSALDDDAINPLLGEPPHLVVHQGEQGIDNDSKTFDKEGGEHETQALAAAGRQGNQQSFVIAGLCIEFKDALYDYLLKRSERLNAEDRCC